MLAPALAAVLALAAGSSDGIMAGDLERTPLPLSVDGQLTDFAFLPGGEIVVAQKDGKVLKFEDGDRGVEIARIPVDDTADVGLVGLEMAGDGDHLYTLYTYGGRGGATWARVSRWTMIPAGSPESLENEEVILDRVPVDEPFHTVGTLLEGRDGTLFVGVGDGASPAGRDQLAFRAQDLDSPNGKVLRITPEGRGLPENPFFDPAEPTSWMSRIFATGFRNPFRFTLRPGSSSLYVADVGWRDWEEVDVVGPGDNHGWPCWEGPQRTRGYDRFPRCRRMYEEVTPQEPLWSYPHQRGVGASVIGGTFLEGSEIPEARRGEYVFGDFVTREIGFLRIDEEDRLLYPRAKSPSVRLLGAEIGRPVRFRIGPDGAMYYGDIESGRIWRVGAESGMGTAWLLVVVVVLGAGIGLVLHRRRAEVRSRSAPDASGRLDVVISIGLGLVSLAGSVFLSRLLGLDLWEREHLDLWFNADVPRAVRQMADLDAYRLTIHPLFSLSVNPPVALMEALGMDTVRPIRLVTGAANAAWVVLLFLTLRAVGSGRPVALLFTGLGMLSASALFLSGVPETFALGAAGVMLVLLLVALSERGKVPWWAWAVGWLAAVGYTVTNVMVVGAAAVAKRRWVAAAAVIVASLVVVLVVSRVEARFDPRGDGVGSESRFLLHPDSGGPVRSGAVFLTAPIVMPEVHRSVGFTGSEVLSVQRSSPWSGNPLGMVSSVLWAGLLGLGVAGLIALREQRAFRITLGLTLIGQLALHSVYGDETFLYSLHYMPLLVLIASLAALGPLRKVALWSAGALLVLVATNNVLVLRESLQQLPG